MEKQLLEKYNKYKQLSKEIYGDNEIHLSDIIEEHECLEDDTMIDIVEKTVYAFMDNHINKSIKWLDE